MGRTPTGRQKRRVNPEILRTFISTVRNVSSDLGSEQLQKRILAGLRRAATRSNSKDIAPNCRDPDATQILSVPLTGSVPERPSPNPLPQIVPRPLLPPPHTRRHLLARQPLQPLQQFRHRLGTCTIVCPDCNALHWIEEASSRKGTRQIPKFGTCCMNGAISLPQLPDAPILIEQLLKDDSNGNYRNVSEAHCHSWILVQDLYSKL